MVSPLVRIAAPLIVGAAAGIGAIVGASLARERRLQLELEPPMRPLAFEGWWSSDASSSLAHAHPAVLMVDAASARVIDSWDRRRHARVEHPVVRRTPEWPREGAIVVDAATGDLLAVLSAPGPAGMPAA
jgi:hypothetical protein